MTAPVAAFLYKRPGHTRRLLASLASSPLASETDLFLFCDAAKAPADEDAVRQVRKEAKATAGFNSVTVVEREQNWGLSRSVTGAVSELCAGFGRVIAVEDDLVLAPSFLQFMNDALVRYQGEERVMQVTGFQFDLRSTSPEKCVFLPIISCWGWATWARAWKAYDASGDAKSLLGSPERRKAFNLEGAYDYVSMLEQQREGKIDSWGVRWYLNVFERDGLVLFPPRSLVSNEGFDGSGTHSVSQANNIALARGAWPDPSRFTEPDSIALSGNALAEVQSILRAAASPGLIARLRRKLAL